jgi:hypothetical protein
MLLSALAAALVLISTGRPFAAPITPEPNRPPVRIIGQTVVVGESDPLLWKAILDLLPARPQRIELLDVNSLPASTRQQLRGVDAFVLAGQTTIVVIRQGATLRQAEFGDAFDRLVLASLVWHELAHANGLDEEAALEQEQTLWRRFIAQGLVNSSDGMAYVARLREVRRVLTRRMTRIE